MDLCIYFNPLITVYTIGSIDTIMDEKKWSQTSFNSYLFLKQEIDERGSNNFIEIT